MQVGSFEQMQKEFQNGTYNLTQNGKCTGCGNCCSNLLPMTDEEIEVIRKYIKRFHIKEQKRNMPLAEPMLDLMCPFLDNSKKCEKCTIYEVTIDGHKFIIITCLEIRPSKIIVLGFRCVSG